MESASSIKRARPPGSGRCSVDGCTADLNKCRDYHRRHKVCEVHSKTPKVSIRGQEQRFCQQCSRFHSLAEFDEGKRSCRKRLDGHNRRRRKPQRDAPSVNHPATGYLPFSRSMNDSSTGAVKFETEKSSSLNFSSRNISFLQCTNLSLPGVSVCQPLINTNPSSSNGGSSRKMLSNGLNRTLESNHVLSLLSSQPAETREISLSPMVQDSGTPPSLMPSLQYKDLGVGTILATNGSSNANRHGPGVFRTGQSGSSGSGTH